MALDVIILGGKITNVCLLMYILSYLSIHVDDLGKASFAKAGVDVAIPTFSYTVEVVVVLFTP